MKLMQPILLLVNLFIISLTTYFWVDFQITLKHALPADDLLIDAFIANINFYLELIIAEFLIYLFFIISKRFYFGITLTFLLIKLWISAKFFYQAFSLEVEDYIEIFQEQWVYLYFLSPLITSIFTFIWFRIHTPIEIHRKVPYKHYILSILLIFLNIIFIYSACIYIEDIDTQGIGNSSKAEIIYEIKNLIFIAVINLLSFLLLFAFIRNKKSSA